VDEKKENYSTFDQSAPRDFTAPRNFRRNVDGEGSK
jgi:hypothetical protein